MTSDLWSFSANFPIRPKFEKGSTVSLTAAAHVSLSHQKIQKRQSRYKNRGKDGKLSVAQHQKRRELFSQPNQWQPLSCSSIGKRKNCNWIHFAMQSFTVFPGLWLFPYLGDCRQLQQQQLLQPLQQQQQLLSFGCQVQLCATIHSDLWHCRQRADTQRRLATAAEI